MDTRKLQIVHEFDHEPTYIVTSDDNHEEVATVEPTTPNAVELADELVRRWNQHDELVTRLNEALVILRETLRYIPASGDDDMNLRETIEDVLKK